MNWSITWQKLIFIFVPLSGLSEKTFCFTKCGGLGSGFAKASVCGSVDPSSNPVDAKFLSTRSNLFLNKPNVQSACLMEPRCVKSVVCFCLKWSHSCKQYQRRPKSVEFDSCLGVDKVTQPYDVKISFIILGHFVIRCWSRSLEDLYQHFTGCKRFKTSCFLSLAASSLFWLGLVSRQFKANAPNCLSTDCRELTRVTPRRMHREKTVAEA